VTSAVLQILRHGSISEIARVDRSDSQLLDLFVRHRDQEAFTVLVQRHGPLVLGVCKRILRNSADAEDAFQAAFLVLARKAATIGTRELLAQWLYGVAYNTARKLRRTNARRAARLIPLEELSEPCVPETSYLQSELLNLLDEELSRLPVRYRMPIVLCDLEGISRKDASRLLGWPEGTVAGRLARARTLLASRLTSRGIEIPSAVLGTMLSARLAEAIPPELIAGIVRAVSVTGVANAVAKGMVSARVANTTEGVLKTMFLQKLKTAAIGLMLCGLALAGATGIFRAMATAQTEPNTPLASLKDDKAEPKKPVAPRTEGKRIVTVVSLKKLKCKETAEKLTKLFPESVTVAPARDENVLLVYATEAATKDVFKVLEILGEERQNPVIGPKIETADMKPAVPKMFALNMQNVSWTDALKWYSEQSDLGAIYTVKPEGNITLTTPSGRQYTIAEITDLFNEALQQQKLIMIRGQRTFTIVSADEKVPQDLIPHLELSELNNRGNTEIVEVDIKVPANVSTVDDIAPEIQKLLSRYGSVIFAKSNHLVLCDTAGNLKRILAIIQQIEKQKGNDPKPPTPKPRTLPFKMQNVPWSEVMDWYAKESGLRAAYTVKPLLKGRFHFIPPAGKEYTLTEITDIVNEGLVQRHYLLIPNRKAETFTIVPADEKVNPALANWIKLDELKDRGNTELVEVTIPLPADMKAKMWAPMLLKLLSQFGRITWDEQTNTLFVIDLAVRVRRIVQTVTGRDEVGPAEKKFSFKMKDVPWDDVLTRYGEMSGLLKLQTVKPKGNFTFSPQDPERQYTLKEVTDIINEGLASQKLVLIRRQVTFFVCPTDEPVDP
jgi:RNA polymerase sigma factor (sigma-70 family)